MRKFISIAVLVAAMTLTVQAQGIKFGVKAGLNITKMSFNKDVFNSDNKVGFFVGPSLKLSLPLGFGVDIAALYDERSANVELESSSTSLSVLPGEQQSSSNETIKQKSIQVPVNLRYNIGLSSMAGIYLAVGPQFGFPVADKVFKTEFGEYRLKDASLSVNFGAGLSLMGHLEVGFTYNLAAGKSGEFTSIKDIDTHNNAWQISAAYYF